MSSPSTIQPPDALASRVGGSPETYRDIAQFHRERIISLLPADWIWDGKRILDFGCGPGRTLSEFSGEAQRAEFFGCDIHAESIAWAIVNLPQFTFVRNEERPPVDLPSSSFDLVFGVSIFTHLTEYWSGWLSEVHRLLRPGGLAILSFLGEAMWDRLVASGGKWDEDEIGMMVTGLGRPWNSGGPNVFHSDWWLREHWGRGFEVLELRARDAWHGVEGHGWIALRRGNDEVTAAEFQRVNAADPREARAMARNLRYLMSEAGEHLAHTERLQRETAELQAELERLRRELSTVLSSRSWRLTAPLRSVAQAARERRTRRGRQPRS
jgi:SAM-dependent methyltransferase